MSKNDSFNLFELGYKTLGFSKRSITWQPQFDFQREVVKSTAAHNPHAITLFPDTRNPQLRTMQVYIFTMPNHFLILLSLELFLLLPTHTGDGLYQVNPLYCRPFFTYPISQ